MRMLHVRIHISVCIAGIKILRSQRQTKTASWPVRGPPSSGMIPENSPRILSEGSPLSSTSFTRVC